MNWDNGKRKLLHELAQIIANRAGPAEAVQVDALAKLFFRSFPAEDLRSNNADDLYGFIYGAWHSMTRWPGGPAKVRIFNPDLEKHGWQSSHTAVVILAEDMPFLLDSARGELNRRNTLIHKLHGQNFSVLRGEDGMIESVGLDGEGGQGYSLIYFELDHCSDLEEINDIRNTLDEILGEVRCVVDAFGPMREKLAEVAAVVRSGKYVERADREEHAEFLDWLGRDNFTLLGYECLGVQRAGDGPRVGTLEDSRLGILKMRNTRGCQDLEADLRAYEQDGKGMPGRELTFSKSRVRSRVHRFAYPEYIEVNEFDEQGATLLQHRFMGLYTSPVYTQSPVRIPIVRRKVERVMELSGLDRGNYEGRELARVLELFPRDELFQAETEQLCDMATAINQIQERRQVRLLSRTDNHGKFFSCVVYMPRDRYTTAVRMLIQDLLSDAVGAEQSDFTTFFSESILVRIYFVLRLDADRPKEYNVDELEQEIIALTQSWEDLLRDRLIEEYGEERGGDLSDQLGHGFPPGYRDDFDARIALVDIGRILKLESGEELAMSFYRMVGEGDEFLRLRLFHQGKPLPLSDVLPILENLGLRVVEERPYAVREKEGEVFWIQEFKLVYSLGGVIDLEEVREEFTDAFARIWMGEAESDAFNKLLLGTSMNWREIAMLRACARYLKQIRFPFSIDYIAETLAEHLQITGALVELFLTRMDPNMEGDAEWRQKRDEEIHERILEMLDSVENLGQDQIIRQYLAMNRAMLRTNFFQRDREGRRKNYFSFKLQPGLIPGMPQPRPAYEIYVYSPRVEGVHLRGGKVARGGLRWSDRHEDFRTEVLGLVKAQQVKNAVIVPVGAKGGFVTRRAMPEASREEIQAEGVACYQIFIRGLLDVSDNLQEGEVVPPPEVVRLDDDDTYLVVAADKGTATFSDIANEISADYRFWLGDAFASGGSEGYDHKKMGITARGAWVSVQQHFREMGVDTQREEFTVVGVGDMAGDVFGNGMLLSEHILLTAAFNHMHIFIDPNPEAAASFAERSRLFNLDRSSWEDYNSELISAGGGIFRRAAKSIAISPEMQERFGISETQLAPNELVNALLKAPVDLLWNGGIGTYVKSKSELHSDVGDKANDAVRVDGSDLRCKVVGEGGNLGMSQLGRVEFALNGGRCNTDFIDNAGGVDCSDHEVNIKILLNAIVARGDLTPKHRNKLLEEMTDAVAELVLENNFRQAQAISMAEYESAHRVGEYQRMLNGLEESAGLDRKLEFLPSDEGMVERRAQGLGLTRPELSVVLSYSKGLLKEQLIASDVADDSHLARAMDSAFPQRLLDEYREDVQAHGLRREIIATQIANDLINSVGVSFLGRLISSTGSTVSEVAVAYVTARDIFGLREQWDQVDELGAEVEHGVRMQIMVDMARLARRASRWLLRNNRVDLDPARAIADFASGVSELCAALPSLLQERAATRVRERYQELIEANVGEELAQFVASSNHLYAALGIISAARESSASLMEVAELYFMVGENLELDWFSGLITSTKVENMWQALARDTYLEDLEWQQRSLAVGALKHICEKRDPALCISRWMQQQEVLVDRWRGMLAQLHATDPSDFSMFAVANRELLDLAQSSLH